MNLAADKHLETPETPQAEIRLEPLEPTVKSEVPVLDLLIIIGRRKKFLVLSTLVVGAVSAIGTCFFPIGGQRPR